MSTPLLDEVLKEVAGMVPRLEAIEREVAELKAKLAGPPVLNLADDGRETMARLAGRRRPRFPASGFHARKEQPGDVVHCTCTMEACREDCPVGQRVGNHGVGATCPDDLEPGGGR